jgi:hypothetical protein
LKRFNFAKEGKLYKLAFGVVETIRPVEVLDKMDQLFVELRGLKKEDGLDFAFLAVVDILKGGSTLLMAGQSELALGKLAYPNNTFVEDGNKFFAELPGICSRKLQFIPPLSEVLQGDWVPPAELLNIDSEAIAGETFGKVVLECTEHGCIVKRRPTSFKQIATNVVHAQTLIGNASDHSSGCSHHHGHSGHAQDVDMDPAEAKKQAAETAALYSHPVLMATMQDVLDDAHSNDPDSFVQRYSAALAAKLQTSA